MIDSLVSVSRASRPKHLPVEQRLWLTRTARILQSTSGWSVLCRVCRRCVCGACDIIVEIRGYFWWVTPECLSASRLWIQWRFYFIAAIFMHPISLQPCTLSHASSTCSSMVHSIQHAIESCCVAKQAPEDQTVYYYLLLKLGSDVLQADWPARDILDHR